MRALLAERAPGRSVRAVALAGGIDPSGLAKALRGEASVTPHLLQGVARALSMSVDEVAAYLRRGREGEDLGEGSPTSAAELFDMTAERPPAWQFAVEKLLGEWADEAFRRRFVENFAVFLLLSRHQDPGTVDVLRGFLCSASEDQVSRWLEGQTSAATRRIVFHALLFTLDPVAYARHGGVLAVDRFLAGFDTDLNLVARVPPFGRELVEAWWSGRRNLPASGRGGEGQRT